MQDGATPHTAGSTVDYLRLYCNLLEEWPSSSPDLNPIENLWAIIKHRLAEIAPTTIDDLITTIFQIWESIPQSLIDNLIDSMNARISIAISKIGDKIGY